MTITLDVNQSLEDWGAKWFERYQNNRPLNKWTEHYSPQRSPRPETLTGELLFQNGEEVRPCTSPLVEAVSQAYNVHVPLVLSPDSVWLAVLKGLNHFIEEDPETVRSALGVQHEGQIELVVRRGGTRYTQDYARDILPEFAEKIKDHIGKRHDLIVSSFSTTGLAEKAASEIALLGSMKAYFTYKGIFLCGLKTVVMEGTPEDWQDIAHRVSVLSELPGIQWWMDHLQPVVNQFALAAGGHVDRDFWCRLYKRAGYGSGSQGDVTGWINTLHPYLSPQSPPRFSGRTRGVDRAELQPLNRNQYVNWENASGGGVDEQDFPSLLVKAPIVLDDNGTVFNAEFVGGLTGVSVDPSTYQIKAEAGVALQCFGEVAQ